MNHCHDDANRLTFGCPGCIERRQLAEAEARWHDALDRGWTAALRAVQKEGNNSLGGLA